MASDHPFTQLFETSGKLPEAHAEGVNRKARGQYKPPEQSAEFAPQADFSDEPIAREPVAEESPPLSVSPFEAIPALNDLNDVFQAALPEAEKDESTSSTTDRIDDLLKQFRERYGKN